jgi:hypothetical protein
MAESVTMSWQIINQAWTKAEALAGELNDRLDDAEQEIWGSPPSISSGVTPITSINEPNITIPLEAEGPDLTVFTEFDDAIFDKLVAAFAGYMTTYFPTSAAAMAAAETWLVNEINNGGSGINATIEAQIWERDRSRILADAVRAVDEVAAQWSAKRFPIPAGALQYQTAMINAKAQDEIAKSSREAAIDAFKAELEMVKFAIDAAMKARLGALNAAGDYIKAIASSQGTAVNMAMGKSQAQNGLINAAAAYYNARANAADVVFKSKLANSNLGLEASKTNVALTMQQKMKATDVAVSAADAVARQAAAMLNNLHTSVGVSGSEKIT